jgi:hypothetical protein
MPAGAAAATGEFEVDGTAIPPMVPAVAGVSVAVLGTVAGDVACCAKRKEGKRIARAAGREREAKELIMMRDNLTEISKDARP